ncbi:MAG: alpha/beta hydrolase, partial [Bacteroidota bacterium]
EKDQMAEDLFAVADALGINTFYLGGHDWGGAIVQEMTLLKPERIRKLLILNMIIINNAIGQQKALKTQMRYQFRTSWYQNFMSIKGGFPEAMIEGKEELWIRFFSRGISNPIPEDAIQEYIRCYKIPGTLTTAGHIYRSIPKDRKRWKEYESIVVQVPTKIIHGILDPVVISDYLEGIQTCYADVSITELEGGHFICDEQPEAVGKAMTDFLNQGH